MSSGKDARPGTARLRAGIRQKSGSGSPPMGDQIRSDSLARIVLVRWPTLAAPLRLWPVLQGQSFGSEPGPPPGSERAVGREAAAETPGERMP